MLHSIVVPVLMLSVVVLDAQALLMDVMFVTLLVIHDVPVRRGPEACTAVDVRVVGFEFRRAV